VIYVAYRCSTNGPHTSLLPRVDQILPAELTP
jgi:hypothetical protein